MLSTVIEDIVEGVEGNVGDVTVVVDAEVWFRPPRQKLRMV